MDFRTLGKNGPKVSRIGMGVWQASDLWKGDDEQIVRAITRSHELGVNRVDTAEAYGNGHSEQVVGRALRDIGREEFVVATKVHGANLRYDELRRAAAASMKRLGVNEIDLYQIHWPDPWEQIPLKETMKALRSFTLRERSGLLVSATLRSETSKRPDPTCPGPTSSQTRSGTTFYNEKSRKRSYLTAGKTTSRF